MKTNSHFTEYPLGIYVELFWSSNYLPNLLTFSCNVECTNSFHGVSYEIISFSKYASGDISFS